jgi:hypothetical protein
MTQQNPQWQDSPIPGPNVDHNDAMARALAAKREIDRKHLGM